MEAPKWQDAVIEIDGEGTLHGDDAVLAQLKNQQFRLRVQGRSITLEPAHRRLSEIEDVEERAAAYQAFKVKIMRPGGGPLPNTRSELNDVVYD